MHPLGDGTRLAAVDEVALAAVQRSQEWTCWGAGRLVWEVHAKYNPAPQPAQF